MKILGQGQERAPQCRQWPGREPAAEPLQSSHPQVQGPGLQGGALQEGKILRVPLVTHQGQQGRQSPRRGLRIVAGLAKGGEPFGISTGKDQGSQRRILGITLEPPSQQTGHPRAVEMIRQHGKQVLLGGEVPGLQSLQPGLKRKGTAATQLLQPGPAIRAAWWGQLGHHIGRLTLLGCHGSGVGLGFHHGKSRGVMGTPHPRPGRGSDL